MNSINFKPWVGKNYLTKGFRGKRILVLGESHYCKELSDGSRCHPCCNKQLMNDSCHLLTQNVVHELTYEYEGQSYLQSFVCFERAVAGKVLTQKEREEFWESVVFYNYIQYELGGPRTAPLPEHWANSKQAFVEILETYKPDYILVWGVRLYNGLPDLEGHGFKLKFDDGDTADYWVYTIKGQRIPALKMHHPSAPTGKNWDYWHKVISKFLEQ